MQVEVSKHTEGSKDKMLRPNGLPESLIRYDGIYSNSFSNSIVFFFPDFFFGDMIEPVPAVKYNDFIAQQVTNKIS